MIAGGGTAGWITAALLNKVLGKVIDITLVESAEIGTVGVGEASIPPILHLNGALGIFEKEFIKATGATIKLGIEFENWRSQGHSYMHAFGEIGKDFPFCEFYHFWLKANQANNAPDFWDFSLNYQAAKAHKFAHLKHIPNTQLAGLHYAYHFDATRYGEFLKELAQSRGVKRIEGKIESVNQCHDSGYIRSLLLKNGEQIDGDLFIDCTGLRALLIEQTLNTGFEDWSHWLPCDSAIAVQSESASDAIPYTRSIARDSGWQWQIPLQHRVGNGLVYSSRFLSDEAAKQQLLENLPAKPLTEPRVIKFKTGRRLKQWHKNVIAIGLSSGFLEPLESTSIHLIQSAIIRLVHLFPHQGIDATTIQEYNQQSKLEFEQIRDFLILHYHLNNRGDSAFWRDMSSMEIPSSLSHKIAVFADSGRLFREQNDLFLDSSWLQVLIGQGVIPKDFHPIANSFSNENLNGMLSKIKAIKNEPLAKIPSHDEFLKSICQR